jgi:hypothetical protein
MITKQEMFNRAVLGLASQGWKQCIVLGTTTAWTCSYSDDKGKRCAWGWVDPTIDFFEGDVRKLREECKGIAADLNDSDLEFALALQKVHDNAVDSMDKAFCHFGKHWGLEWPL